MEQGAGYKDQRRKKLDDKVDLKQYVSDMARKLEEKEFQFKVYFI